MRPVLRNFRWAFVHRMIAVTLAVALTVVSVGGGHAADHRHGNDATTTTIAVLDVAKEAAGSGDSHKCHLAGNCSILGLPGTEYHVVAAARHRASFFSAAPLWQSLDLPPAFKPPIA